MKALSLINLLARYAAEHGNLECDFGSDVAVGTEHIDCRMDVDFDIRAIEHDGGKFVIYGRKSMIEWRKTACEIPACDREIIVKNPDKFINPYATGKSHAIKKFRVGFSGDNIRTVMLDDGYTLWSYL